MSKPGEIYRFEIEVLPISYLFKKGHRVRLEISNYDSNITDALYTHPYHGDLVGSDTFFHSQDYPSRLMLPVVD